MSKEPTTSPDIGLLLNDRYRVEELIARGGMATVYRGFDERLHRPVALKIMHPHLADNPEFVTRFSREARSVARLSHPHIVSLHDQGEDRGRVYLAMQLVEGETLRDELREHGSLTLKRALRVGRDVLSALDAAHRAGIIHRDVKPENVLVNREREILVADFGLARAVGTASSSATGTLLGTVAYVSPEVVTRGVADARSDLYSWGIMMFEMLTGRTPFHGDSPVHIAYMHAHEDIPAPSTFFPGMPASIDALVTWAAARLPSSRPSRAHEVLLALDDALDTLGAQELNSRAPRPNVTLAQAPTAGVSPTTSHLPRSSSAQAHEDAAVAFTSDGSHHGGTARTFSGEEAEETDESIREVEVSPRVRPAGWRARGTRYSPVLKAGAIAALAIGLVGAGFAGTQWYQLEGPGSVRTVPLLAGASLEDAESALAAEGLAVRTRNSYSDSVPKGHIVEASPAPGAELSRGDAVSVVVSLGEQLFPVPNIDGKPADEARTAIESAGFTAVEESEYSETVQKGTVIRHKAAAPTLAKGETVTFVVSDGPEPIDIPSVTGKGRADAVNTLESAGFSVKVSKTHSSRVPAGAIVSQDPGPGTGRRGQEITLVESLGPDMVKVPNVFQKPEAQAKAELEKAGFKVNVQYDRGKPVFGLVYQQSASAGGEAERGSTITLNVF